MTSTETVWAAHNPNQARKLGMAVSSTFQGAGTIHPRVQGQTATPHFAQANDLLYQMEALKSTAALADPALGANTARAMDLLCAGADVAGEFHAAAQNAAASGHDDVLKLVLAVDAEFEITKQDALRAASRKRKIDSATLLMESAGAEAIPAQKQFLALFAAAVAERRREEASTLMHTLVRTMFPRSPDLKL